MERRFYVAYFGSYWNLSKKGYLKFLEDGRQGAGWDLSLSEYEAREIKKQPTGSKPIDVTDFKAEHYKEELEYLLKTGEQTGFKAPNDARKFYE